MSVTLLLIRTDEIRAKKLADRLSVWDLEIPPATGAYNIEDAQWGVTAYFEEPPDESALIDFLQPYLDDEARASLRFSTLEDKDWVAETQAGLVPVHAGRFVVHGSHDRDQFCGQLNAIEIDAGQAFGTAHHGTTRGCLILLDRLFRHASFKKIVDVGTGSGVLAIACSRMSRQSSFLKAGIVGPKTLASDNDPVAIQVARENCRLNGAAANIQFCVGDGLGHRKIRENCPYDLVIANILAGPLLDLAPQIAAATKPGSCLVLSGLLNEQAAKIRARYCSFGFVMRRGLSLEGWTSLLLQKRL